MGLTSALMVAVSFLQIFWALLVSLPFKSKETCADPLEAGLQGKRQVNARNARLCSRGQGCACEEVPKGCVLSLDHGFGGELMSSSQRWRLQKQLNILKTPGDTNKVFSSSLPEH